MVHGREPRSLQLTEGRRTGIRGFVVILAPSILQLIRCGRNQTPIKNRVLSPKRRISIDHLCSCCGHILSDLHMHPQGPCLGSSAITAAESAAGSLAPRGHAAQREPSQPPPSRASSRNLGSPSQTRPEPQREQQPSSSAVLQMPRGSFCPEPTETGPGRHLLSDNLQQEVTDQPRPVESQASSGTESPAARSRAEEPPCRVEQATSSRSQIAPQPQRPARQREPKVTMAVDNLFQPDPLAHFVPTKYIELVWTPLDVKIFSFPRRSGTTRCG